MKKTFFTILFTLFLGLVASAEIQHFQIDPTHSGVTFKVRHILTKVPGSFEKFEGNIDFDSDNMANCKVTATIEAGSVDTNNDKRDEHLLNEDFFNVESYPLMTFESISWLQLDINSYEVFGELTMLGHKKPVTLNVKLIGMQPNKKGVLLSGWEATTVLDREDWGMSYGSPVVGNEVEVELNIEAKLVE